MPKRKQSRPRHPSFAPSRDYLLAMLPVLGMATYLYGLRVPVMAVLSLVTALVCDLLTALFMRRRYDPTDLSSYLFGLVYTIMLPASMRYTVIVIGTVVTVVLGKAAFGGYGRYPFHPAAFGFAFMSVCLPDEIFMYPRPFSAIGLGMESGAALYPGIAGTLKLGGLPTVDRADLLLGKYPGPLGTTFCLILLACLVLLIARRTISWQIPFFYLLSCMAWSLVFVRIPVTRPESALYEMLSGALVFSALFIVSAPSLAPKGGLARAVYGIVMGLAVMFYRTVGVYEMSVCFAVLLINPLAPYFDRVFAAGGARKTRKGAGHRV